MNVLCFYKKKKKRLRENTIIGRNYDLECDLAPFLFFALFVLRPFCSAPFLLCALFPCALFVLRPFCCALIVSALFAAPKCLVSLSGFASACDIAGMKISTFKTELLHLSRNPDQYPMQVGGVSLKQMEKFEYLGVAFTSDERRDKELVVRSGKARTVMRALHHSVVLKRELSKKINLLVF